MKYTVKTTARERETGIRIAASPQAAPRNDRIVTLRRIIKGNSKQVLSLRGPEGAVAIRNPRPDRLKRGNQK